MVIRISRRSSSLVISPARACARHTGTFTACGAPRAESGRAVRGRAEPALASSPLLAAPCRGGCGSGRRAREGGPAARGATEDARLRGRTSGRVGDRGMGVRQTCSLRFTISTTSAGEVAFSVSRGGGSAVDEVSLRPYTSARRPACTGSGSPRGPLSLGRAREARGAREHSRGAGCHLPRRLRVQAQWLQFLWGLLFRLVAPVILRTPAGSPLAVHPARSSPGPADRSAGGRVRQGR